MYLGSALGRGKNDSSNYDIYQHSSDLEDVGLTRDLVKMPLPRQEG